MSAIICVSWSRPGTQAVKKLSKSQVSDLIEAAIAVSKKAYKPYSHYPVGAAVLCGDGSIVAGANIENSSYPAGICAERSAFSAAVSMGHKNILAVAVFSPKGDISPCGICRQFISEFGEDVLVLFMWEGSWRTLPISKMLPYAFSKRNLK